MKPRLRAVMELVRLPNLLTALADVWAGFLLAGGTSADVAALVALSVASMLLYAGGMALNDVCDARRDATLRPERPIPSGRLSRAAAARLAIVLLGGGLAAAACLSVRSASIAGALVASIVLYDAVLKTTPLAPGVMGLCRALNLVLGLSVVPIAVEPATLAPVALVWLYVASLTLFARRESVANGRAPLSVALVGVLLAVVGQAFLVAGMESGPSAIRRPSRCSAQSSCWLWASSCSMRVWRGRRAAWELGLSWPRCWFRRWR